ncbi:hypothetical protein BGX29_004568 [Mortierella sp. GBA35]|nr:hypothetical protein BGX29_004568 [Mortierella sp. GBA35]
MLPTTTDVLITTTEESSVAIPTTVSVTVIGGTIFTLDPNGTPITNIGPGSGNGNLPGGPGASKGLSSGATAGLAVGSVAVLALIAGAFFLIFRRQSRRLQNPNSRFVSRSAAAGAGAAGAGGDFGHLYGSRQPEGSGSHGSVRQLAGGGAGHIVVAPEMMEHPANRSNHNLQSGPMAFGTNAALGASSGLAAVHAHDGYHESSSDGREISSSYGASGGSAPGGSAAGGNSNPFGTATGSVPSMQGHHQSSPSGGSGSPQSQKGSIHYI